MKKSIVFTLVLVTTFAALMIFPVKESSAVRAYEWLGSARRIVCYDYFPTEVSAGLNVKPQGGIGGEVKVKLKWGEGRETVCEGFWGLCPGTNCEQLSGQQL